MTDNFNKTLELLELSLTSKDDNNKQLEISQKLKELSKNKQEHITILIKALSINIYNTFNISLELHESISIYLKNFIQSQLTFMDENEIKDLLYSLFDLMFNSGEPNLNVISINKNLNEIIELVITSNAFLSNEKNLDEILSYLLNEIKNNNNFIIKANKINFVILIISRSKCIRNVNIERFIKNFLFNIADVVFSNMDNYINVESIQIEYFVVLDLLCNIFNNIFMKLKHNSNKIQICFDFVKKYNHIIYNFITFKKLDEKKENQQIINFSNNLKLKEKLNSLKSKVFLIYSFLLQLSSNIDKNILIPKLIKVSSDLITLIINSLENLLKNPEQLNQIIKGSYHLENPINKSFEILIYNMFYFLSKALVREPIKKDFLPYLNNFLLNIAFPLITSNNYDKLMLENDGQKYYNTLIDNLQYCNKNYKNAVCCLIKILYEKITDISNFIVSYVFQMLQYILMDNKPIDDPAFSLYLKSKRDGVLIDKFDDEIKIDFCFNILIIFHNYIINSSFESILKQIFSQYNDKFNNINSPLIKSKMCIIYDYYYLNSLLKDNLEKENQNIVNFLLNSILQLNEKYFQGLSYCASRVMYEKIIQDDKNFSIISDSINQENNLKQIIYLIENYDIISLFDVLKEIILNIQIHNRELLFVLLKNIIIKLEKYIIFQKPEFISECFNILDNCINGINKIQENEVINFSEMILPIVNYIKNPKKIEFEDDIINLVNDLMNSCKTILPISLIVFQNIKSICQNNSTINEYVFNLISSFLLYKNNNKSKVEFKEIFNEILLIIKNIKINDDNYDDIKFLLLLYIKVIAIYDFKSDKDFFNELILYAYNSYKKNIDEEYDINLLFINLISLGVIFIGMIYFSEKTYFLLKEKNILDEILFDFLNSILYISSDNYLVSIIKCIILGICSILSNNNCLNDIIINNKFNNIMMILFKLTVKQKNEEIIIGKFLLKKETKWNFIDENDEFDEEEDLEYYSDKNNINKSINQIDNINNSDVYENFTTTMKHLKELKKQLVLNFVNSLFNSDKKILENLIHTREVETNYNNQKIYIPRRTVKIKRNIQLFS